MRDNNSKENSQYREGVTYRQVGEAETGQRIDNFLHRCLKGVPKSKVYRILRKGEVRVNKGRIKAHYKLCEGDIVRIPPIRVLPLKPQVGVSRSLEELLNASIIYEDAHLLVINKPSGLAVHGGSGVKQGLIEALRVMRPEGRYLELVHRLDRDTSGCIMIAKKRSMLRYLHQLLRDGGIDKRYLALVAGRWPNQRKVVSAPLLKNTLQSGERMVNVSEEGKKSLTHFTVIDRFSQATLIEAKPITGRTHQIRVHALYVGHPLVGDEKYGRSEVNREFRGLGLKRLFLHAANLTVPMPEGQSPLKISAPLSSELLSLINQINTSIIG